MKGEGGHAHSWVRYGGVRNGGGRRARVPSFSFVSYGFGRLRSTARTCCQSTHTYIKQSPHPPTPPPAARSRSVAAVIPSPRASFSSPAHRCSTGRNRQQSRTGRSLGHSGGRSRKRRCRSLGYCGSLRVRQTCSRPRNRNIVPARCTSCTRARQTG